MLELDRQIFTQRCQNFNKEEQDIAAKCLPIEVLMKELSRRVDVYNNMTEKIRELNQIADALRL